MANESEITKGPIIAIVLGLTGIIGGILKITDTTAWGYVEMTKYAMDYIYTAYRVIKEWLEITCEEHGIIRLQAWIECGVQERLVFAEHLGFTQEGPIMRDFLGKNQPAYLYVRYIGGQ